MLVIKMLKKEKKTSNMKTLNKNMPTDLRPSISTITIKE